jgi:hypothetical protein
MGTGSYSIVLAQEKEQFAAKQEGAPFHYLNALTQGFSAERGKTGAAG